MSREHTGTNRERSEYYGALQDIVNALFAQYGDLSHHRGGRRGQGAPAGRGGCRQERPHLPEELLRIVTLLPPGDYTRQRLCTQLNSAIAGHAWGQVYGTVE